MPCLNGTCLQCSECERAERHQDALETRAFQIARELIKRGRESEWARKVGDRFAEIEFKQSIEWY